MTKKEQAAMDALRGELARAKALCFPQYPKPEPLTADDLRPVDKNAGGVVVAWHQNNYECRFEVRQGCSNGVFHSTWGTDKTTSQGAGTFYRTKLEALQVARHEMTERYADTLARIDAAIEDAKRL